MHSNHPAPKAQKRKMPAWFYDWRNDQNFPSSSTVTLSTVCDSQ